MRAPCVFTVYTVRIVHVLCDVCAKICSPVRFSRLLYPFSCSLFTLIFFFFDSFVLQNRRKILPASFVQAAKKSTCQHQQHQVVPAAGFLPPPPGGGGHLPHQSNLPQQITAVAHQHAAQYVPTQPSVASGTAKMHSLLVRCFCCWLCVWIDD
mgnify:CR=1 FL=1